VLFKFYDYRRWHITSNIYLMFVFHLWEELHSVHTKIPPSTKSGTAKPKRVVSLNKILICFHWLVYLQHVNVVIAIVHGSPCLLSISILVNFVVLCDRSVSGRHGEVRTHEATSARKTSHRGLQGSSEIWRSSHKGQLSINLCWFPLKVWT